MSSTIRITHEFDEEEGRFLFYVEGVIGGPVIYADSIEEGESKMKELIHFGNFANLVTFIKHRVIAAISTIDKEVKQHNQSKDCITN